MFPELDRRNRLARAGLLVILLVQLSASNNVQAHASGHITVLGALSTPRWRSSVIQPVRLQNTFLAPKTLWGSGHRGIDLLTTDGAVVLSPAAGTVVFSGLVATKPVVAIQHGAIRSAFEPACGVVPVGTEVASGQLVATVCGQGYQSHCAPQLCLHESARTDAGYLSPQYLMGELTPSRLMS
jgi:hypothetical protein